MVGYTRDGLVSGEQGGTQAERETDRSRPPQGKYLQNRRCRGSKGDEPAGRKEHRMEQKQKVEGHRKIEIHKT